MQAHVLIHALDDAAADLLRAQEAAGFPQLFEAEPTWMTALSCECRTWRLDGKSGGHVLMGTQADESLKARLWVLAEQLGLDDPGNPRLALVPHAALAWLTPHDAEAILPLPEAERADHLEQLLKAWQG